MASAALQLHRTRMIACSMSTVHESVRFKRRACRLSPRLDFSAVHADACRVCCPSRPAICSRRPRVCVPHGELLSGPCTPIAYRASGDRARNRLRATATAHWQLRPARAPLGNDTRLTLREFVMLVRLCADFAAFRGRLCVAPQLRQLQSPPHGSLLTGHSLTLVTSHLAVWFACCGSGRAHLPVGTTLYRLHGSRHPARKT